MGKLILLISINLLMFFTFVSCDSGCENENPTVTLVNNGTGKADIQIKTSGGNTENINNIEPGTSSEKRAFAPGDIEFTISIQGVQDPIIYVLSTAYCYDYLVKINSDNSVSSSGTELDKVIYQDINQ